MIIQENLPAEKRKSGRKCRNNGFYEKKALLRFFSEKGIIEPLRFRNEVSAVRCPYCAYPESKVIDSRPTDESSSIRRRRECLSCGKRFTTYEIVERVPMVVVKKDGSRQTFDRGKILGGLIKACEKRPVPTDTLERAASRIEQKLVNSMDREIPSVRIGELVMEELKDIDQVAYVRFASVYRQFKDLDSFMDELNRLLEKK